MQDERETRSKGVQRTRVARGRKRSKTERKGGEEGEKALWRARSRWSKRRERVSGILRRHGAKWKGVWDKKKKGVLWRARARGRKKIRRVKEMRWCKK